jgi:hypothetical protein
MIVSISGVVGFSLLVKEILKVSIFKTAKVVINEFKIKVQIYFILLCILAFSLVIFSTFLTLKTINDGTYSEIFAMWAIFPFYMVVLIRSKWITSGVLLAIIAATHNLSLIMVLAVTIAYLSSFLINRKWKLLKKSILLFITFGILSIPSFILFYLPTIQGVIGNSAGGVEMLSQETISELLTPTIYYSAMAASFILLILNYKRLSWLSIWIALFFAMISFSPLMSSRVTRESSVVFSMIIGICIAYSINLLLTSNFYRKLIIHHRFLSGYNLRIILVIFVLVLVLPVYSNSQYGRLQWESNPLITYYYSDAQNDSYEFLLSVYLDKYNNHSDPIKDNIVVYGYSPWLKTLLYDYYNVYEALARDFGDLLSSEDKVINDNFLSIVEHPDSIATACILKELDIEYLYIADDLFQRFYTSHQSSVFYGELNLMRFFSSPFLYLEKEFNGDHGERVQIYSVNKINVDNGC